MQFDFDEIEPPRKKKKNRRIYKKGFSRKYKSVQKL
jgi:hypothetical protein